ncbi:hypothetical protein D9V32_13490 [Mycetocola tolaasinivorans]|uniref:Uncharacterized protein n=1 Tax=Mycetocola tolaasinivorans TaxID=76635 RepID=A0A3L7A226_9MICO|nr:hypothetical protein [Mycetocola tolaasinivorans]RLP74356.1 hypothetical protein D9V32_13490 [Mycetocola tolaasinivorans]
MVALVSPAGTEVEAEGDFLKRLLAKGWKEPGQPEPDDGPSEEGGSAEADPAVEGDPAPEEPGQPEPAKRKPGRPRKSD